MTNKLLFPALALGLGAGAFFASQSFFSRTQGRVASPAESRGVTARTSTSDSTDSTASTQTGLEGRSKPRTPRTIIRTHKAPPRLSAQEEAAKGYPKRTSNMRTMIGLSLSESGNELKGCVVQAGLPFSKSTIRFHVDSSSASMIATTREVIAVPDSLRQCIAAELGTYEIAAEEGAPFLEGYSDILDVSLTINEPPAE